MAVSSILDDIAKWTFDPFIAGKVECMGRSCPQHGDIKASQWSKDPLCLDDLLQSLIHSPVLCIRVWLQTLHPCLWKQEHILTSIILKSRATVSIRSCCCAAIKLLVESERGMLISNDIFVHFNMPSYLDITNHFITSIGLVREIGQTHLCHNVHMDFLPLA